jgi:crotonobetainyl-CoA:carnitine CoA-transferase CaiB-like acyl-CoA transferase
MLNDLRVLELGDGVAAASCGAALAGLGARVRKLVHRPRPIERHAPAIRVGPSGEVSLISLLLDREKQIEPAPERANAAIFGGFDLVVCDRIAAAHPLALSPADYLEFVRAHARAVWVTISPFGLDGPQAGYAGGELVAAAAGGLLATIAPKAGGRPALIPGQQALKSTGWVAALAALHGLDRFRTSGRAVHVDVSAQEAVAMTGALPECAHAIYACPGRAGSGRYSAPAGLFPTVDGWVRIAAIDDHQWAAMVEALGHPDWTRGLEDRPARAANSARIDLEVAAWTKDQRKSECENRLQRHGVPATAVNDPHDLLDSPQFALRGFVRPIEVAGTALRTAGPPYRIELGNASSAPPDRSLGSLRIAEFTHVLAGPIAGALLGAMGAQVVRFEDRARLDMYRRSGPFAEGRAGVERGAYFTVSNHSKRSLAIDVEAQPDAARRLAASSDVVLENFGQRRMQKLGVDSRALLSARPGLLAVSLSGFGSGGPLAEYRAYANNVHAYGGLTHLTRDRAGGMIHVGTVLADPLASVTTALAISAWALGSERDRGGLIDVSMAEVVAQRLEEFIAEASLGGGSSTGAGTDLHPFAPHGVYTARDGRWLAIAVQSDGEWQALVEELGRPASLCEPAWRTQDARWDAREALDLRLEALIREYDADALFRKLQAAGVRACPVWSGAELIHDAHLAERGFFPEIDHPDPELGRRRIVGLGWRFAGEGPIALRPPPRLGDATLREVEER